MTVLYPNQCYNESCYKGTALYIKETADKKSLKDLLRYIWAVTRENLSSRFQTK